MMKTRFRFITGVLFSVSLLLGYIFLTRQEDGQVFYTTQPETDTAEDTGSSENEDLHVNRYVAANDPTLIGEQFKFDVPTTNMVQNIIRDQTFKRKPVSIDPSAPFFDIVVPVTGASNNHYREFRANIGKFSKFFPGTRVIFYDLGLNDSKADEVKLLPFITFRKFDFDAYPPHVRNLHNYAWKPLLIQQVLAEFDGAMWFDTSVRFQANTSHVLEHMARFKSGILFYVRSTEHSILGATHPAMLKYFPMKKAHSVDNMLAGGACIIVNTADIQKHVMKWACVCALNRYCIAPRGSRLQCSRSKLQLRDKYANCHRFDQALMSILATNLYNNERKIFCTNKTLAGVRRVHG